MSFGRVASTRALVLLACLWCCRIYRDPPGSGEGRGAEASPRAAAGASAELDTPDEPEGVAAQRPGADALNLWVLNRPKGELVPYGVEDSERAPSQRAAEQPKATALVVLGIGEARACSEWYVGRAVDALAAGSAPVGIVASVLEAGHRFRWADADSTVSAMIRSSSGDFGGVQAAPPASLSASMLAATVERHVLLDGRNPRALSRATLLRPEPAPDVPPCKAQSEGTLRGPLGVLLRTSSGEFFGGLISVDLPADAGVVSVMNEYGVALSVGPRGGVLMVSDCPVLPPERVAERVYASPNWASSTADPNEPGRCATGHALLTVDRAWATTGSALSWAAAEVQSPVPLAAPAAPAAGADAGASAPALTVPP
jgi:hypothetical protein